MAAMHRLVAAAVVCASPAGDGAAAGGNMAPIHREWWAPLHSELARVPGASLPHCCDNEHAYKPCAPGAARARLRRWVGPEGAVRIGGPERLRRHLAHRRVLIVGDSIAQQWYESLLCYAGTPFGGWFSSGAQWDPVGPDAEYAAWAAEIRRDLHAMPVLNIPGFIGFHIQHPAPAAARGALGNGSARGAGSSAAPGRVRKPVGLLFININVYLDQRRAHTALPIVLRHAAAHGVDLAVVEPGGLHLKTTDLRRATESVVRACAELPLRCALREPTPQHFAYPKYPMSTSWGLHLGRAKGGKCRPFPGDAYKASVAGLRGLVLRSAAGGLRVLPAFDALAPLGDLHVGVLAWKRNKSDCTHYWSDTEIWEPLHIGLVDHLDAVFGRAARAAAGGGSAAPPVVGDGTLGSTTLLQR